jgi:hypothetical protein
VERKAHDPNTEARTRADELLNVVKVKEGPRFKRATLSEAVIKAGKRHAKSSRLPSKDGSGAEIYSKRGWEKPSTRQGYRPNVSRNQTRIARHGKGVRKKTKQQQGEMDKEASDASLIMA